MQLVPQTDIDATLTGGNRFVVNLVAEPDSPAEIRSCEVIGSYHRNRFTFPSRVTVEDVFVAPLAQGIAQCLSSLSQKSEVISLPTMAIEIPGLSLAKAHLMTTLTDEGQLSIILRFKLVLGGVSNAFKPELGIEDSTPDYTAHLSALVLTDIVMPLLDLCSVAESSGMAGSKAFDGFMDTLIDRSRDVRFQAELIKRFVNSASESSPKPVMGGAGATTQILVDQS